MHLTPTAGFIPEHSVHCFFFFFFSKRSAYITSPAKVSSKTGNLLLQLVCDYTVAFKRADTRGIPAMWKTIRCSPPSAAPKIAAPASSSHANPPPPWACVPAHRCSPVSHLACLSFCVSQGCPAPMLLRKQGAALVGEQSSVRWVGGGATRSTA